MENSNHNRCHTGTSITITLHYQGLNSAARSVSVCRRLRSAAKAAECNQDRELRAKRLPAENDARIPRSVLARQKTKMGIYIAVRKFTSPHFVVEFPTRSRKVATLRKKVQPLRARRAAGEARDFAPLLVKTRRRLSTTACCASRADCRRTPSCAEPEESTPEGICSVFYARLM